MATMVPDSLDVETVLTARTESSSPAPTSPRRTSRCWNRQETRGRVARANHPKACHQRVHGPQIGAITAFENLAEAVAYARPPSA